MKIWYALVNDSSGENKQHYLSMDKTTLPDSAVYICSVSSEKPNTLKQWINNALNTDKVEITEAIRQFVES